MSRISPGRLSLQGVGLVVISQGMISASNLSVSLFLLYFAQKTELGLYTLAAGIVLLGSGLQNAILITPLSVTYPQLGPTERRSLLGDLALTNLVCALLAGLLIWSVGVLALRGRVDRSSLFCAALAFAQFGSFMREFRRTSQLLEGEYRALALSDALMAVICGLCLGGLVVAGKPVTATAALVAVGLAATATSLSAEYQVQQVGRLFAEGSTFRRYISPSIRWTVPGVLVSWAQSNLFAYIVGLRLGAASVGEIGAAKLAIAPGAVAATAWNRYYLPKLAQEAAERRANDVLGQVWHRILLTLAGGVLYTAMALTIMLGTDLAGLPAEYRGMSALIVLWLAWFVVATVRTVVSSALLALSEYRKVVVCSVWGAAVTLALLIVLMPPLGSAGSLVALVVGEIVLGTLCYQAVVGIAVPDRIAQRSGKMSR